MHADAIGKATTRSVGLSRLAARSLDPVDGPDAGRLAEPEAADCANRFVTGRAAPAPLDTETRAAIESTTGRRLSAIQVIDPSLSGRDRLGEATGRVIRLAPEIAAAGDALGRRVRLHEAAHVAQAAARAPPAATDGDVERDARAVAAAAERGEHRDVGVHTDPAATHGFSTPDAAAAAADPEAYLRENYPELADLYDNGLDGLLQRAGDYVGSQLTPLLAATGFDQLGPSLAQLLTTFHSENLAFGALTDCCECLETALTSMLLSFDSFLASPGPSTVQRWFLRIQQAETGALLDLLAGGFDKIRTELAPILVPIADAAIAVGEYIWKDWICYYTGLDPNLPPLQAIEQKLGEAWAAATAAFTTVRAAAAALWAQLKQNPIVAYLATIATDCTKLVGALRKVQQARSRDPKVWLAILAEELQGTIFEELIAGLQSGHDTAVAFADAVDQWFRGVLEQLGILGAWNTAVPYISGAAQAIQGFFKTVRDGIAEVQASFQQVLTRISDALMQLYAAVKPLLDFGVGFVLAMNTAPGGLVTFAAGQIFRNLPFCYQAAITDFILDLFIHAVEWLPATWPPTVLIRSAALGGLKTLRGAPVDQKVGAMTTVMRFVSGDVELVAGFIVGFFPGLWASSLGLIFRLCFPLIDIVPQFVQLAGELLTFVAVPFEKLWETAQWFIDLAAGAKPIDEPRKDEKPAEEQPAPEESREQPDAEPDEQPEAEPAVPGTFELPPAFPGFPFDLRTIFDEVLRGDGITRADLEQFLAGVNVELAELGEQIGGEVAPKVLVALNDDSAPYHLGEIVGKVSGWVCGELIVLLATFGVGSLIGPALEGEALLANILRSFPQLVGLLNKLRAWLKPVIDFVSKIVAKLAQALKAVLKWIDDLILWAKNQLKRILAWIDDKLGRKKPIPKPKPGVGDDDDSDTGKIASAAAKDAWTYLTKHLDQNTVHDRKTIESTLAKSGEDGKDGVKVTLSIDLTGEDGWQVSADASDTMAKTYGDGWAPKGWKNGRETSEAYFGFRNDRAVHDRILEDAEKDLLAHEWPGDTIAEKYDAVKAYLGDTTRARVMSTVKMKGVEFVFELEGESDVEKDSEAKITLVLTPNASDEPVSLALGGRSPEEMEARYWALGRSHSPS